MEKTDNSGCEEVSDKKGFVGQKCELRTRNYLHCYKDFTIIEPDLVNILVLLEDISLLVQY
jgi:hypothetical protein